MSDKDRTPETPFGDKQLGSLELPLDEGHIEQIKGGPRTGADYVPWQKMILEANRTFGFGGWSVKTSAIEVLGMRENQNGNFIATAEARCTVTAGGCIRDGYGFRDNEPNPYKQVAVAMAKAGAESMALKSALSTFGPRFALLVTSDDPTGANFQEYAFGSANQRMPAPPTPERRPTMQPPQQQRPAAKPRTETAAQGTWGAQPEAKQPSKALLLDLVQEYLGVSQQIRGQATPPPSIGRAFQSFQELHAVRDGDPNIAGFIAEVEADLEAIRKEGL